jgi:hypothetical protein
MTWQWTQPGVVCGTPIQWLTSRVKKGTCKVLYCLDFVPHNNEWAGTDLGMWRHIVWQIAANVSDEPAASISRIQERSNIYPEPSGRKFLLSTKMHGVISQNNVTKVRFFVFFSVNIPAGRTSGRILEIFD